MASSCTGVGNIHSISSISLTHHPTISPVQSAFEKLGVMPEIIAAIEEMEWMLPTPVQDEAIPLVLGGGDVLAVSLISTPPSHPHFPPTHHLPLSKTPNPLFQFPQKAHSILPSFLRSFLVPFPSSNHPRPLKLVQEKLVRLLFL
eukprot:TRINITY_DN6747_c0_g1_i1.p1 TRINITY_DN6747_c0_g1~~TRINITY_DN6747_c0_g1_i1.p1  ORF type:complete len:145 (+),score=17.27 TRINITY_DN6747_c0_g1_i1:228-662(+)